MTAATWKATSRHWPPTDRDLTFLSHHAREITGQTLRARIKRSAGAAAAGSTEASYSIEDLKSIAREVHPTLAAAEARVEEARRLAMQANVTPHLLFPDTDGEDWLDCGQCRDCFIPSFNYRPGGAAQYIMALTNFDDPASPRRFRHRSIAT